CGILVENLAGTVGERDFHADHNENTGRTAGGGVVGERGSGGRENGSIQGGVGILGGIVEDAVLGAGGEFAHHRSGQHLLDAIGRSLVFECRNGDGLYVLWELPRVSSSVVAATRERQYPVP